MWHEGFWTDHRIRYGEISVSDLLLSRLQQSPILVIPISCTISQGSVLILGHGKGLSSRSSCWSVQPCPKCFCCKAAYTDHEFGLSAVIAGTLVRFCRHNSWVEKALQGYQRRIFKGLQCLYLELELNIADLSGWELKYKEELWLILQVEYFEFFHNRKISLILPDSLTNEWCLFVLNSK